jgi:hypothetical protein
MKKSVQIFTLLGILLLLPSILAIEITFSKDLYQPQELFQAQITGNFLSLTEENIFIYKGPKAHPEPIIKGLTKQNNIYYFYAILPNEPGNLTFRIENTEYLERGVIKSEPIIRPLNLVLEDESDLSINPGFIIANNDDIELKVKSLFGNVDVSAIFEPTGEEKFLSLIEQEEETIKFSVPTLGPGQTKITINDYEIPVFLIKNLPPSSNLEFIPHIIEGTITPNNDYQFIVLIRNPGPTTLENIAFSSELNTNFEPSLIELLEPNQTVLINLTITIEEVEEDINSNILATLNEQEFFLPVAFVITNNETEVEVIDATNTPITNGGSGSGASSLSCSQLGNLCTDQQSCSGDSVESLEGPCCIGSCLEEESGSSSFIIGVVLLIILVLTIGYVVWRAKRKKNLKSPEQILEDKKVKYKKRMKGEKVDGKLDKV